MNDTITAELDINLVELILESCTNGTSLNNVIYLTRVPRYILKVHLFYLVDHNMISYVGQEHVYLTQEGWKLFSVIDETKNMVNLNDDEYIATITLE
jgi:hypothetical protein